MIDQNIELNQVNVNVFDIRLIGREIQELFKRYGGVVHIKVTKPQNKGTDAQNKAMHSLLKEYYKTGMHSCPTPCTRDKFKYYMKRMHGPIPFFFEIAGNKEVVLKSWADYNKQERSDFIDGLISEIHQSGAYVESEKIQEIIAGMELNK